ncbi:GT2 family glycosyltransferase [Skermanella aerolata]|uniref:glycosyltransferase n=1 Tax=Skermanella aerolata TaxID=393310 RepID=UPI003D24C7FF
MTRSSYVGELRALHGETVVGWAFRPDRPEERTVVEILIDGYPVTLATADMFESSLRDRGIGDGCHAFVAALPSRTLTACGRITVRIANDGTVLPGAVSPQAPGTGPVPLRGEVRSDGGLRLTGWVWDPSRPDHHSVIRLIEGNRQVAALTANERRADLVGARIGSGDHGFTAWLPLEFADGKPRQVLVLDEEGTEIAGSPVTVLASSAGASTLLRRTVETLALPADPRVADTLTLVERQLRDYERRLPRSAGFGDYADWHRGFSQARDGESAGADTRFTVLVHGAGDTAATVRSLQAQSHGNWRAVLEKPADGLIDIRMTYPPPLGWAGTWRILRDGREDILVVVQAGNLLPAHALARLAAVFADPAVAVAYSDCDRMGEDGGLADPWFKPDWDPDLFLSQDYLLDLFTARLGLYRAGAEALGPADLPFLAIEALWANSYPAAAVRHIPEILYHRRGDARPGRGSMPAEASLEALRRYLARTEPGASAEPLPGRPWLRRVRRPLAEPAPLVSIIIPTRDKLDLLSVCVSSILERTVYPEFEILILDNQSSDPETLRYFDEVAGHGVRVLPYTDRFNYAAINNAGVEAARGPVVCLLNNDVEVISPEWVGEMVALLLRPGVGAVGAKLLWPNGMVQHGGVVIGTGGLAAHAFNHITDDEPGYADRALVTQRYSAVTAACLICRKSDYQAVGGLDAAEFPVAFNDVDFCLKLGAGGLGIVWTPFARLFHFESASRGAEDTPEKASRAAKEMAALRRRWGEVLADDPCYSPSLNLDGMPFTGLALPPRRR